MSAQISLSEFKPNGAGARKLMKSGEVRGLLKSKAERVASDASRMDGCPGGFGARVAGGKSRAHAFVYPCRRETIAASARNNTLLKAMGGVK